MPNPEKGAQRPPNPPPNAMPNTPPNGAPTPAQPVPATLPYNPYGLGTRLKGGAAPFSVPDFERREVIFPGAFTWNDGRVPLPMHVALINSWQKADSGHAGEQWDGVRDAVRGEGGELRSEYLPTSLRNVRRLAREGA